VPSNIRSAPANLGPERPKTALQSMFAQRVVPGDGADVLAREARDLEFQMHAFLLVRPCCQASRKRSLALRFRIRSEWEGSELFAEDLHDSRRPVDGR